MCHIYIYLYTRTHGHTHTFSCRPHSFYFLDVHESPWVWKADAPNCVAGAACMQHALKRIFLAIVQPFYSSKPYHESLHSFSLSISISHTQTQTSGFSVYCSDCFLARCRAPQQRKNWGESHTRSLISPQSSYPFLLAPFVSDGREDHYFLCITSDERAFSFMM